MNEKITSRENAKIKYACRLSSSAAFRRSEGQGLTDETIAACTSTVRIPMTDRVESLNAGIAGSILLWHFREESL